MLNKLTPTDPTIEATVQRIETYGGGFAQKLMAAYRTADMRNKQRIIDAFEESSRSMVPMGSLLKGKSFIPWLRHGQTPRDQLMAVISIHETTFDDQRVYVEATVEDMVLVHAQTMLDPAEYGPALCEASFIDPEVPFPHNGAAFLRYVDDLDLNWKVIDTSDRYLD